jgi:class I fructose-bisphosphate aldolase
MPKAANSAGRGPLALGEIIESARAIIGAMPEIPVVPSARQAGKVTRLRRIFGEDGRCLFVPLDHGTIFGRLPGLEDAMAVLRRLIEAPCDGFLLGPALLRRSAELFGRRSAPARILTMDVYWRDPGGGDHRLVSSVETAAALGADGVKLLMPWDVPAVERVRIAALVGSVVEQADRFGLPVMVEPLALEATGAAALAAEAHGCRTAAEMGVDILKIAHPGDEGLLRSWCEELGVPIMLLGGGGTASRAELVSLVKSGVHAGVSGIIIGRKVWGRPADETRELLAELYALVHG